ncbi:hypothetical protein [Actinokineospora iranica]|uniref:Uncharacterized protein n=1 Tax=Actinokineospora iranica TaxID=1271860 RepID=A0A1G6PDA9_9PSEU|nr:hypothetical protein [Actinokineospora iranica]SDC78039.1 hypothetical protein SAMN05216174_104239 [Actinokineospora iranica]
MSDDRAQGTDDRLAELTELVAALTEENRVAAARTEALTADVETGRRERDLLRAELAACREERDRLRLRLLDAELALAAGDVDGEAPKADATDAQRAQLAEHRASELARELSATRETVSWKVTKPLRAVRRKIGQS